MILSGFDLVEWRPLKRTCQLSLGLCLNRRYLGDLYSGDDAVSLYFTSKCCFFTLKSCTCSLSTDHLRFCQTKLNITNMSVSSHEIKILSVVGSLLIFFRLICQYSLNNINQIASGWLFKSHRLGEVILLN